MTPEEAIKYIENHTWSTTRLGLERTRELLRLLGDPQKKLRFVHVAGSNGKGSACAMLERILREAGFRTGLYISPHIQDFRERMQVCGEMISGADLARITGRVAELADSMEDHPSQFELSTAIAMQYFREQNCDIVVLEVGMGGALDSTNVIDAPEVAVIMNIGLEHTEYLGSTLQEIAAAKAGIIKSGSACVCYDGDPSATAVIRKVCAERKVPFTPASLGRLRVLSETLDGQEFTWNGKPFFLALLGRHQLNNAAVVLCVIDILRARGWSVPEEAVRRGLAETKWPARLEVLWRAPLFILDGGHNPQCAGALAASLGNILASSGPRETGGSGAREAGGSDSIPPAAGSGPREAGSTDSGEGGGPVETGDPGKTGAPGETGGCRPGTRCIFLLGVLKDKDYRRMTDIIAPFAGGFVCLTPSSPRALPAEELARELASRGFDACAAATPSEGITMALGQAAAAGGLPVVAFGSLYMAGAVRSAFLPALRKWLRRRAVAARESLSPAERAAKSAAICERLLALPELKDAKTIMLYHAVRAEADLSAFAEACRAMGKNVAYPICISKTEMTAVLPGRGPEAWAKGYCGIDEPLMSKGTEIRPENIDLVVCPCSAFDPQLGRLGMGGGFYDRWLPKCRRARIAAAAFDAQELPEVPRSSWDHPMDTVVTESRTISGGQAAASEDRSKG